MSTAETANDLADEFATVDALLDSDGTTRRTDAFVLTWVKMEKQLRRLFCFLVYQHPEFGKEHVDQIIKVIVDHRGLYFSSFIKCIDKLGVPHVRVLVGDKYDHFQSEITRIRRYRNKIFHGQVTGQKLQSRQIEKDTRLLRAWIEALASGSEAALGYNGIGRNTFWKAKAAPPTPGTRYPFNSIGELRSWLVRNAT